MSKIIIIGAGFGGLSAACYLAKAGHSVTVYEKNSHAGGRGMVMRTRGFTFDLGPSWYMMPDVFEEFFSDFGKSVSNVLDLRRLDPSYKIFTQDNSYTVTGAPSVYDLFERLEPGSSVGLQRLLAKTEHEYQVVREHVLNKPLTTLFDVDYTVLKTFMRAELLGSYHSRIKRYISHPELQKIVEFMVVFMGGSPRNIPAFYTLLSHVDFNLGIHYPMGGMGTLVEQMRAVAESLGVEFVFNAPVERICTSDKKVNGVEINGKKVSADVVVGNADRHHIETALLGRNAKRWERTVLSPSGLLVYLGVSKKLKGLEHHNLFFDSDWDRHFEDVFEKGIWSNEPMFYVSAPSVTDDAVAPKGSENLFILAPMASGDQPNDQVVARSADALITRIEQHIGQSFASDIVVKDVRAHDYFKDTFNAYRGNAFGLAHTMRQSAFLRPPLKDRQLTNMYYVGQYTNPGTGVPIVVLSGKVVAGLVGQAIQ
jgi:phytoene desaturase